MESAVYGLCAFLAWLAFACRLFGARSRVTNAKLQHAFVTTLGLLAVVFTTSIPAVSARIDQTTGVNNLAAFLIQAGIVSYSCAQRALLVRWTAPPDRADSRVRLLWTVLSVVLPMMMVLLLVANVPERDQHFMMKNAGRPEIALYIVCFAVLVSTNQISTARLCWRHRRKPQSKHIRRSLQFITVGAAITLGYCTVRVLDIVARWSGFDPVRLEPLVPLFAGGGSLVALIGFSVPIFASQLSCLRRSGRLYYHYWRLRPLWAYLRGVHGGLHQEGDGTVQSRFRLVHKPEYLLYERTVAIRDGLLLLQSEPAVNSALYEAGRPALPDGDSGRVRTDPAARLNTATRGDPLVSEAKLLISVSDAIRQRPAGWS